MCEIEVKVSIYLLQVVSLLIRRDYVYKKSCCNTMLYFFFFLVLFISTSIAQTGNRLNRCRGLLNGNEARTLFWNQGEIGDYPNEPTGCWLADDKHYINAITLMISVATTDNNGNRIHPLETQYYEFVDESSGGIPWGFEPLPGYFNPYQKSIALSDKPSTWPAYWPDKLDDPDDPGWSGHWNSYFGKDLNNPLIDLESYYVMDDDADEEWDFYPDENDHSRRGVGLEISVRALQSAHPLLEDVIFWIYDIKNEGTHDYDSAYVGFYIDWGVGGIGDTDSDFIEFDKDKNIVYAYDGNGYGYPNNWNPVGYAGISFLETPISSQMMTGLKIFKTHECELLNDELIWQIYLEQLPSSQIYQIKNPASFISSGSFSLKAGESVKMSSAIVFGENKEDLFHNVESSKIFYNADFKLVDSISVLSALFTADQNFGAPPTEVQFTDHSTTDGINEIVSWYWNFGDNSTSTEQNPKHSYTKENIYDVTLIVIDQSAKVSIKTKKDCVIIDQFKPVLQGVIVEDSILYSFKPVWGDYNNDGYQDLFISRGSFNKVGIKPDQINSLYQNNGGGVFTTITSGDMVNEIGKSADACWGDYNNDGYLDLFIANGNDKTDDNNQLYKNIGDGTFTKITEGSTVNDGGKSLACGWADYDLDGFIDLFVANHGVNFLYRNNGDGTFIKVLNSPVVTDTANSNACCWGDYDNDGDPDLYMANYGDNHLYENNGNGTFTKINGLNIVTDGSNSQKCNWVDFNNDGYLDLFVANGIMPYGEPNLLFINNGDATFTKVAEGELVSDANNSLNSCWEDYNNDGDIDLLVVNSVNVNATPNLLENNNVYLNDRNGCFHKLSKGLSLTHTAYSVNMGAAWTDFNNDGFTDLIATRSNYNAFYINKRNQNHWINITCVGTTSNFSAIGTRIRLKATIDGQSVWQMRDIYGQDGSSLNARFGLGNATVIDSIVIEWPGGLVETYVNKSVNQFAKVTEGVNWGNIDGKTSSNGPVPDKFGLSQNYPNPFNPVTTIKYELPQAVPVKLQIFDLTGRLVQTLVDEHKPAGHYSAVWDAHNVSSGIYLIRLNAGDFTAVKKCVKLK